MFMEVFFMARKKFTTSLDEKVIEDIKIQAIKEGTDVSKIIEKLLIKYIEDNQ